MKEEYYVSRMEARSNPKGHKKQITLRLGWDVIDYFKGLSEKTGVPYQRLINMYLRDCVTSDRELNLNLAPETAQ